jgi:glycine dehydrogenase subunit 2
LSTLHPYQPPETLQGMLGILYELEEILCAITGMKAFTFQPSSGAHGEFTGMLMIRKFHEVHGRKKTKVIVPDSAHGTNPATASMCGYTTVVVESTPQGLIDIEKLRGAVDEETAAVMLTNPNTLGLFEEEILTIRDIVQKKEAFLYYDGANFNALLGITKPSLMGFDVIHLNLHKTFATPHGCGGPGAGVVGVSERLLEYLPVPVITKRNGVFAFEEKKKYSIGKVRSFYGNIGVLLRAYAYLLRVGQEGLRRVSENAVLNANYVKEKLKDSYTLPFAKPCMHEVVFSCSRQKEQGVSAMDIAKRLIDFGIHPPTMYFPLIVREALMVEPTETESKQTLDYFIRVMKTIQQEIDQDPARVKGAPYHAAVKRVDEIRAARFPQ